MKIGIVGLIALAVAMTPFAAGQGGRPGGGPMIRMGGPGGNSELTLVVRKDVQGDLGLTAEQKKKVEELHKSLRRQPGGPGGGFGPPGGGPPGGGGLGGPPGGGPPGGGGLGGPPRGGPPGGGGLGGPPGGDFDPDQMRAQMEKRQAEETKKVKAILTEAQFKRLGEIKIQFDGNSAILIPSVQKALGVTAAQKQRIESTLEDLRENMGPPDFDPSGPPDRQQMEAHFKKMHDEQEKALGAILTDEQRAKLKEMGGKPFKRVDPKSGG